MSEADRFMLKMVENGFGCNTEKAKEKLKELKAVIKSIQDDNLLTRKTKK